MTDEIYEQGKHLTCRLFYGVDMSRYPMSRGDGIKSSTKNDLIEV